MVADYTNLGGIIRAHYKLLQVRPELESLEQLCSRFLANLGYLPTPCGLLQSTYHLWYASSTAASPRQLEATEEHDLTRTV